MDPTNDIMFQVRNCPTKVQDMPTPVVPNKKSSTTKTATGKNSAPPVSTSFGLDQGFVEFHTALQHVSANYDSSLNSNPAYIEMVDRADQLYKQVDPSYIPGSNYYPKMTETVEDNIAVQLLHEGYSMQWIAQMTSDHFRGGMAFEHGQYNYEEAPVVNKTNAFDEALKLWNNTPGTIYYEGNYQKTIPNKGQPSNPTQIIAKVQGMGYSPEDATVACMQAEQQYHFDQAQLITNHAAQIEEDQEEVLAKMDKETQNCVVMLNSGKTESECFNYLSANGWSSQEASLIIEHAYIYYTPPTETFLDKTTDFVGDLIGSAAEIAGDVVEGAAGVAGKGANAILDSFGMGTILLIAGIGIVALIIIMKVL